MLRILIPARGGSKRIKHKNLLKINGKSLLSRAIKVSLKITNEVYVSTDSYDIEKEALLNGAKIHKRPPIYATDTSPTHETITDFLNTFDDTTNMVLLQCTSPFIELKHLKLSIKNLNTFSSSISVYKETPFYWEKEDIGAKPNYDPFNKPHKTTVYRLDYGGDGDTNTAYVELITADHVAIFEYHLRYIENPPQIGNKQDCVLADHTHKEIVRMAVVEALEGIESPRYQSSKIELNEIE